MDASWLLSNRSAAALRSTRISLRSVFRRDVSQAPARKRQRGAKGPQLGFAEPPVSSCVRPERVRPHGSHLTLDLVSGSTEIPVPSACARNGQKYFLRLEELRIPSISRYFATVRRAITIFCWASSSTSFWSLWGWR